MIHVRTSTIEQFRRVLETSYATEEELVAYVSAGQTSEPNWKMAAGTAWHTLLSEPNVLDPTMQPDDRIEEGDFSFSCGDVNEGRCHRGSGLCEVTAKRVFDGVEIEGTCDHLRGLVIRDAKTKFSPVDPMDYAPSLQWKIYTLLFGTEVFVYDLFSFKDPEDGYCELKAIDSFRFWRYAGLEDEVRTWVRRFVEWAGDRHLLPCLQTRREYAR